MDHDRLFKVLLTTFFVQFVELFLPDLSAYTERDRLEFLDKEIFTDIASGERHLVDLLVKVRFKGGRRAFFLIHIENQATSRKDFARRMFKYFARLHEKYGLPIYPIVIFSHDKPRTVEPDHYRVEFPGFRVLEFAFRTIQLNRLNWRDFLRTPNPVASALMAKMNIAKEDRPRVKLECLRMLATLKLDKARSTLISTFMENYLKLTSAEAMVYNRELEEMKPREREAVMNLTQFTNELIEQGKVEGRAEGLAGQRKLVLRMLRRRIGSVPVALTKKVGALSDTQLDDLCEALLDFESTADARAWLSKR